MCINSINLSYCIAWRRFATRKANLERHLHDVIGFHAALEEFVAWLSQSEQQLRESAPSKLKDVCSVQVDEHKVP